MGDLQTDNSTSVPEYYNAQAIGLFGLFFWEVVVTIPFEWTFVRRRRRPRWSLVLYTGCRIFLLLHILSVLINVFGHDSIPCNTQQWLLQVTTSLVIWISGLMLSLRVLAVSSKTDSTTGLIGMNLAGLLVVNVLTWRTPDKVWNSDLARCVPQTGVHKDMILAQFIYTFIFYLVLVIMFIIKSQPKETLPEIQKLVLQDGLGIFVLVTFIFLIQAVITCIWLNDLVNVVFLPLALTIVTIAVTRSYVYEVRKSEATRTPARRIRPASRPPPSSWRKSTAMTPV